MDELKSATGALLLEWARLLAPHYGPTGSMDLDLRDWPGAQGPSFYNQFGHHGLLLLATGRVPGATAEERGHYLKLALGNIEYALAITAADFHTPHHSRGREWGRHIGEWLNYYLLCSLELMEEDKLGSPELRARLRSAVEGAVGVLQARLAERYKTPPTEFVGNHGTWHGLLFYRAGRFFGRSDWREFARDFFARCVLPFQTADGYWPEGHGIVVNYALVTAQAVSLYAELSGDEAAHASIGRFLGFYDFSSLPDGTTAVALDVRMRYYPAPFAFFPPGFLGCAEGRELMLARMNAARAHHRKAGVRDNGAQAFAFFGSFAEFAFSRDRQPRAIAVTSPAGLPAARLVRGPWRAYLAWQLVPEHGSRFVLDTQNFVELWHRDSGYLAGTGGSKFMPRFSTIRQTDRGRAYVPDRAAVVRQTGEAAVAVFGFGADEIEVGVAIGDGGCRIGARLVKAVSGARYDAALMLAFQPDDVLHSELGAEKIAPGVLLHKEGCPRPVREFTWRGRTWKAPEGAVLDYPLVPHNSYTQDGLPLPQDYVARLSFPIGEAKRAVEIS
jgi:hypothetical protein